MATLNEAVTGAHARHVEIAEDRPLFYNPGADWSLFRVAGLPMVRPIIAVLIAVQALLPSGTCVCLCTACAETGHHQAVAGTRAPPAEHRCCHCGSACDAKARQSEVQTAPSNSHRHDHRLHCPCVQRIDRIAASNAVQASESGDGMIVAFAPRTLPNDFLQHASREFRGAILPRVPLFVTFCAFVI